MKKTEITISVKIKPFNVPDHVTIEMQPGVRQDGFIPNKGVYPLNQVKKEVLEKMCDDFRSSVMKTAGYFDEK